MVGLSHAYVTSVTVLKFSRINRFTPPSMSISVLLRTMYRWEMKMKGIVADKARFFTEFRKMETQYVSNLSLP